MSTVMKAAENKNRQITEVKEKRILKATKYKQTINPILMYAKRKEEKKNLRRI